MLWYVVPLGVAAALSVFPILAVVLLLLSPNPIPASVGYLAGWSGGVLVLVTLFSLGARLIPPSTTERMPSWAHVVEIAIGVLLVVGGSGARRPIAGARNLPARHRGRRRSTRSGRAGPSRSDLR